MTGTAPILRALLEPTVDGWRAVVFDPADAFPTVPIAELCEATREELFRRLHERWPGVSTLALEPGPEPP